MNSESRLPDLAEDPVLSVLFLQAKKKQVISERNRICLMRILFRMDLNSGHLL
jgi:hypothetical protein